MSLPSLRSARTPHPENCPSAPSKRRCRPKIPATLPSGQALHLSLHSLTDSIVKATSFSSPSVALAAGILCTASSDATWPVDSPKPYIDQRRRLPRLFRLTGNMHVYREASPAQSLGKALEWDTPPRAKRDLRLHADYLNSFDEPLPPPADSPAQASPLSIDSSGPPPLWWCRAGSRAHNQTCKSGM